MWELDCILKFGFPPSARYSILAPPKTFDWHFTSLESVQFSSVAQSCPTLSNPMGCSTQGFPVHHLLPELTQTHVHRVGHDSTQYYLRMCHFQELQVSSSGHPPLRFRHPSALKGLKSVTPASLPQTQRLGARNYFLLLLVTSVIKWFDSEDVLRYLFILILSSTF